MQEKQALVGKWRESQLVTDESVLNAFLEVPRENFVREEFKEFAYEDNALPSLRDRTISQPTTVAMMSQALDVKQGMTVLEVGAGSGYQAALMSLLVGSKGKVFSLEIVPELVELAKHNLVAYPNVTVLEEDGSQGLPDQSPFDRIMVTAACPSVPQRLFGQLKENGVLVAPVGLLNQQQVLKLRKLPDHTVSSENLGDFVFTPLLGKYGFKESAV